MTFREKLADWISGGALTQGRNSCTLIIDGETAIVTRGSVMADNVKLVAALQMIRDTTATGKSGTARRIHRIANEALGDD